MKMPLLFNDIFLLIFSSTQIGYLLFNTFLYCEGNKKASQ